MIDAYARGVNRYIAERRGRLPGEFLVLQYEPRPWTPVDSLLINAYMYKELTNFWQDEIRRDVIERVGVLKRADAADSDGAPRAWRTAGLDRHAGHSSIQRLEHACLSLPLGLVHVRARNRAGDVCSPLLGVGGDDHFLEVRDGLHGDVDSGAPANCLLHGALAKADEGENATRWSVDQVSAVFSRGRTDLRSHNSNPYTC